MFDKFGEFDSVEELNKAAAGFLKEGDIESLYGLAEENGIDKEDVEDYEDGVVEELATLSMAVHGRLNVESKEIKDNKPAMDVIFLMIRGMCEDEELQKAILRKGKRAENIFKKMREEASKNKAGNMAVACGTDKQLREIIKAYYLGTNKELKEKLESLY